jgi:hypothetical protein
MFMKITQNRFLVPLKFVAGPMVVGIGHILLHPSQWLLFLAAVLVSLLLYILGLIKTSAILYQSTEEGIFISGARTGFYDPEYIARADILSAKSMTFHIELRLMDSKLLRLAIPRRFHKDILEDLSLPEQGRAS